MWVCWGASQKAWCDNLLHITSPFGSTWGVIPMNHPGTQAPICACHSLHILPPCMFVAAMWLHCGLFYVWVGLNKRYLRFSLHHYSRNCLLHGDNYAYLRWFRRVSVPMCVHRIQQLEGDISIHQQRVTQLQVEKEKALADLNAIRKINRNLEKWVWTPLKLTIMWLSHDNWNGSCRFSLFPGHEGRVAIPPPSLPGEQGFCRLKWREDHFSANNINSPASWIRYLLKLNRCSPLYFI